MTARRNDLPLNLCIFYFGGDVMLAWVLAFVFLGIIAGIFGFTGIAGTATWIAQIFFFLFLIAAVASLFWGRNEPVHT